MNSGPLLSPVQLGEQLGVTPAALAQMRYLGTGPDYVKVSARVIRYRQQDVDTWIESRVRQQT